MTDKQHYAVAYMYQMGSVFSPWGKDKSEIFCPSSLSFSFFFNELTIQFQKLNLKKMEKYHLDKTVMFKLHKNVYSTYKTHTRILWVDWS